MTKFASENRYKIAAVAAVFAIGVLVSSTTAFAGEQIAAAADAAGVPGAAELHQHLAGGGGTGAADEITDDQKAFSLAQKMAGYGTNQYDAHKAIDFQNKIKEMMDESGKSADEIGQLIQQHGGVDSLYEKLQQHLDSGLSKAQQAYNLAAKLAGNDPNVTAEMMTANQDKIEAMMTAGYSTSDIRAAIAKHGGLDQVYEKWQKAGSMIKSASQQSAQHAADTADAAGGLSQQAVAALKAKGFTVTPSPHGGTDYSYVISKAKLGPQDLHGNMKDMTLRAMQSGAKGAFAKATGQNPLTITDLTSRAEFDPQGNIIVTLHHNPGAFRKAFGK